MLELINARELLFSGAERATFTGESAPAEEKTDQLPQGIEPQATGHDRITGKVAVEEPQIRPDIQFRHEFAAAILTPVGGNFGYAVQHQHVVDRQLGVTRTKQPAITTLDQFIEVVAAFWCEEIVAGRHSQASV